MHEVHGKFFTFSLVKAATLNHGGAKTSYIFNIDTSHNNLNTKLTLKKNKQTPFILISENPILTLMLNNARPGSGFGVEFDSFGSDNVSVCVDKEFLPTYSYTHVNNSDVSP